MVRTYEELYNEVVRRAERGSATGVIDPEAIARRIAEESHQEKEQREEPKGSAHRKLEEVFSAVVVR